MANKNTYRVMISNKKFLKFHVIQMDYLVCGFTAVIIVYVFLDSFAYVSNYGLSIIY